MTMAMYGDIRDDWKLDAIERKAQQTMDKANEIDALRSTVDSLEHTNWELSTSVDELRYELETIQEDIRQIREELTQQ